MLFYLLHRTKQKWANSFPIHCSGCPWDHFSCHFSESQTPRRTPAPQSATVLVLFSTGLTRSWKATPSRTCSRWRTVASCNPTRLTWVCSQDTRLTEEAAEYLVQLSIFHNMLKWLRIIASRGRIWTWQDLVHEWRNDGARDRQTDCSFISSDQRTDPLWWWGSWAKRNSFQLTGPSLFQHSPIVTRFE